MQTDTMRRYSVFLLLTLFLGARPLQGQQLSPVTLNASGDCHNNNGLLMLDWSLGELAVMTSLNSQQMITQGFHQPDAGVFVIPPPAPGSGLRPGTWLDCAGTTFYDTISSPGLLLEWTLGETASLTFKGNTSMLTQGILQPALPLLALPVLGLDFQARRLTSFNVQLNWQTREEYNNSGFYIQRRKEKESVFTTLDFLPTKAAGGNSLLPLSYTYPDPNDFDGNTYYRLLQSDRNGHASYSAIRVVHGRRAPMLEAWPVPATRVCYLRASGLTAAGILDVYDSYGRIVLHRKVFPGQTVQLENLTKGVYWVRLRDNATVLVKIIMQ